MNKRLLTSLLLGLAVVAAAALGAYSLGSRAALDAGARPSAVVFCLPPSFSAEYAGLLVALHENSFENMKVTTKRCQDNDIDVLKRDGELRFGLMSVEAFIGYRKRDVPLVSFAAGLLETPVVFYVLERAGIAGPADFAGKRVYFKEGTDGAVIYRAMMRRMMIPRDRVREIRSGMTLDDLVDGRLDVWTGHLGNEAYELRRRGIGYRMIRPTNFGLHVPGTVYYTTERTIYDHPYLVERLLRGVIAGWAKAYDDLPGAVRILLAAYPNEDAQRVAFELQQQRALVQPFGRRIAEYDERQWKMLQDMFMTEGLVEGSFDFFKGLNFRILQEAYRRPLSFAR